MIVEIFSQEGEAEAKLCQIALQVESSLFIIFYPISKQNNVLF